VHRRDDRLIAGATAEITGEPVPDRIVGWIRCCGEQRSGREDHAGRAIPALQSAVCDECRLDRVQLSVRTGKPFDRHEFFSIGVDGEEETRVDRVSVDEHRTRTTIARSAAFLCAG
jgi:hypothetical protein